MKSVRVTLPMLCLLALTAAACGSGGHEGVATGSEAQTGRPPATVLVSDIDDTIKQTGVRSGGHVVIGATSTIDEFAGMSMLYRRWHDVQTKKKKITYLTAAPGALDSLGIQFLAASGYPADTPQISDSVVSGRSGSEASGDFKARKLREYYDSLTKKPATIILVGDNGEQDILAYGAFEDYVKQEGDSTAVYSFIHHVYEAPDKALAIASPHTAFLTSADLAVQFFDHGWIDEAALGAILDEVAYDSDPNGTLTDTVVPSFVECAKFDAWPSLKGASAGAAQKYATVQSNVKALCGSK